MNCTFNFHDRNLILPLRLKQDSVPVLEMVIKTSLKGGQDLRSVLLIKSTSVTHQHIKYSTGLIPRGHSGNQRALIILPLHHWLSMMPFKINM